VLAGVPAQRPLCPERKTVAGEDDLAVLTVFFNPRGYRTPVANFRRFHERLRAQGIELHAVELAFGDAPFHLEDLDGVSRLRTRDMLWQFERILNHLVPHLPRHYTKVAWLDSDILFDNPNWYDKTRHALERYPVVQLFDTGVWLDRDGRECRRVPGMVAASVKNPKLFAYPTMVHPGFGWAAQRQLIEKHGIPDFCILGGGDRVLANAIYGVVWPQEMAYYPRSLQARINNWSSRFNADVRGAAGWVEGTVRHLWHGDLANRRYLVRNIPLVEAEFDPRSDIRVGDDGAWCWSTDKPALHRAVKDYFYTRQDDGDGEGGPP
jgi:hypothetical protein